MTIKKVQPVVRTISDAHLIRSLREHFKTCVRSQTRKSDEGALLVEVLVGMLILVIVFTATTIALSNMSDQRVRVEQRDRALKIASEYDELTRVFKCGFIVDRIDDSLSSSGSGSVDFENQVSNCNFGGTGAGDQTFIKPSEFINEINREMEFTVDIRYWWEWPGSNNRHQLECGAIESGDKELPLILVRGIRVTWQERGQEKEIGIVKRDPAPNNSVVFASGNRVTILVNSDNIGTDVTLRPYVNSGSTIRRISDSIFQGQPTKCAVFPYITPDGNARKIEQSATPDPVIDSLTYGPQDFVSVIS